MTTVFTQNGPIGCHFEWLARDGELWDDPFPPPPLLCEGSVFRRVLVECAALIVPEKIMALYSAAGVRRREAPHPVRRWGV